MKLKPDEPLTAILFRCARNDEGRLSARRNQKFNIALRPGDRAFDNALDLPPAAFQPFAHFITHPPMKRRVTDHPALAHFLARNLELRFDQRDQLALPRGQFEWALQNFCKADEARIAYNPANRRGDMLIRQDTRAGLLVYRDAGLLPQLPGELVGPAINRKDMLSPVGQQHIGKAAGRRADIHRSHA